MNLQEHVCATLRDDILACRLPPGAQLREQALAARLGVSKSPVREALLRLAQERLVAVRPRQGYHVAPVSVPGAAELFELRRVLELACVRNTAARACRAERVSIQAAARFEPGRQDFIGYNRGFHVRLAACCGNERLAQAAASAIAQTDRFVHLSLDMLRNRDPDRLIDEHADLARAVVDGDARTATQLLRAHLGAAERRVLDALRQLPSAAASGVIAGGPPAWTTRPTG